MYFDMNTKLNNYKIINEFINIINNDIENYDEVFPSGK